MAKTNSVDTETVLDDLVNQFSDPMSFLRELIQNSIDAGSGEIDVRIEYSPEKQGASRGLMTVFVEDFGEGMNREIIETKLTRLFSSGKDDDYTKIGRFGIGFVSIFAIQPSAVCVDTGRGGEYWRVLFKEDRTFDLIRLEQPVEGTQIRIFKQVREEQVEDFRRRARQVISYWCKHVLVPIYVEGEQVNEPFDIDSTCKISYEEEGTRAVMGFVEPPSGHYGFYNRGLTLKEGDASEWAYLTLKIDSRYLEHTLTRDQVLKDRHYHKAHRLLTTMAEEQLPEHLLTLLEGAAKRFAQDPRPYLDLVGHALRWSTSWGDIMANRRDRRPIIPTLDGPPVSLQECLKRHKRGELFVTPERTHLTRVLVEENLILLTEPSTSRDALFALLSHALGATPPVVEDAWVFPAPSLRQRGPGAEELARGLRGMIHELGGVCEAIEVMDFDYASGRSPIRDELALGMPKLDAPMRRDEVVEMGRTALVKSRALALNASDERVSALLELAPREPEWASFTLCKMLLLDKEKEGMSAEEDSSLVTRAILERTDRHRRGGVK